MRSLQAKAVAKGKQGEREVVSLFLKCMHNVESQLGRTHKYSERLKRNTTQSDRGGFDIVGTPLLAVEVKYCETLQLDKWWEQCTAQAAKDGDNRLPVLFYRSNGKKWSVMTYVRMPTFNASYTFVPGILNANQFMDWYAVEYSAWLGRQED